MKKTIKALLPVSLAVLFVGSALARPLPAPDPVVLEVPNIPEIGDCPLVASPYFRPYCELRAEHPEIDEALANVTPYASGRSRAGDIHVTLQAISDLLTDKHVRTLPPGSSSDIRRVWKKHMELQVKKLRLIISARDINGETNTLGLEWFDAGILLQTISVVAFERNVELFLDEPTVHCAPGTRASPCDDPVVIQELDQLALMLGPEIEQMINDYNDEAEPTPGVVPDEEEETSLPPLNSETLPEILDNVLLSVILPAID
ncbi:MAG: hypothetical protein AAF533_08185 [Acidobacteriota bacterium]